MASLLAALVDLFTLHKSPANETEAAINWEAALDPISENLNHVLSSGLLWGGELTINAVNPATFDLAAGGGVIVNNYSDGQHPTRTLVQWDAQTGLPDEYLATDDTVKVAVDITGAVVLAPMVESAPSPDDRRRLITIGWLDHTGRTEIEYVGMQPSIVFDVAAGLGDLVTSRGPFNVSGNTYAAGTGLAIQRSAGIVFEEAVNYINSRIDPHRLATNSQNPCEIFPYMRDGAGGWINDLPSLAAIDPNHYDDGSGTLASVPAGHFTIQPITYYALWEANDLQYGQTTYATMAEAVIALTAPVDLNPYLFVYDVPRCWLIVQQGTTNLADPAKAKFIEVVGTGAGSSGGNTGGEANTSSSQGTTGQSIVLPKSGVDLPFKSLTAGSNIAITNDATHKTLVIAASVPQGPQGPPGANGDPISPLAVSERIFRSPLTSGTRFTGVSSTAYFVYLGRVLRPLTAKCVEAYVTVGGTGIGEAEIGTFTSDSPPNKREQRLTKIEAVKLENADAIGMARNTSDLSIEIRQDVYLWIGMRITADVMPQTFSLIHDCEEGFILSTEDSRPFAEESSYDGAIIRETGVAQCVDMRLTLD
jgi:hypothetical protein